MITTPRTLGARQRSRRRSRFASAAFATFPKDRSHPPREWAQRFFNVQRWTELPKGGHVAAMEQPEALAEDIREFFRPLRNDGNENRAGVEACG